jgi:alkylation response protein AidB-like acyl-CoA dehydrogenase
MDFGLTDSQTMLVDSLGALLDQESSAAVVRAAEPLGFDASLWRSLRQFGPVEMAVAEEQGGWGASMLDLCLVAEALGRRCAPVPVVETQVAARLLARLGAEALGPLLDDGAIATVALHDATGDTARLVPAGAVADSVLVLAAGELRLVRNQPVPPLVPNHANLPLADVLFGNAEVLASGPEAQVAFEAAIDEWLLLTSSLLLGMAAGALDLAVEYAKARRAFGQPIGAFQGIAHRLADVATDVDGASLLVREAAWSMDTGLEEAAERACMAFAFTSDIARQATYWAVHTLGGYGVMLEYDVQLFFRRVRGCSGVYGGPDAAYGRVARHRYASGRV